MTLVDLKNYITTGIVPSEFLILVNKDNQFLSRQYIDAIGKLAGGINRITSIYEPFQSSLALLTEPEGINVVFTDTFDERAEDYDQFENTIVVCTQVDKSIAATVKNYVITLPKLTDWQIHAYAKTLCPMLEDDDITWLIKATDENIERIENELDKVKLFDKKDQKEIFSAIRFDPQTDLYKADFLTVMDALVKGNMLVLFDFLKYGEFSSIDPVGLANGTLTSLKNIILVSQNSDLTAADLGMSPRQHDYIRRNYLGINIAAVKQKIKFLTNFDLALKTSKLDLDRHDMLSYLVANLAYKITL